MWFVRLVITRYFVTACVRSLKVKPDWWHSLCDKPEGKAWLVIQLAYYHLEIDLFFAVGNNHICPLPASKMGLRPVLASSVQLPAPLNSAFTKVTSYNQLGWTLALRKCKVLVFPRYLYSLTAQLFHIRKRKNCTGKNGTNQNNAALHWYIRKSLYYKYIIICSLLLSAFVFV